MQTGRETDLFVVSKEEYKKLDTEGKKAVWRQYNAKRKFRADKGKDKKGSY